MRSISLCPLAELENPGSRGFGQYNLFVVRKGDAVFAYRNRCPHRGIELEWVPDQFLDHAGRMIQCATHGALFLIENGACVAGPCQGQGLEAIACRVESGQIWVDLDED